MKCRIITLFPEACDAYLNASILGRARKQKKIFIEYVNPRDFVDNAWGKVDERPYGGGPGMVLQALPIVKAAQKAVKKKQKSVIIWFSLSGKPFTNKDAEALKKFENLVLVCGRYEGIDERAKKILKTLAPVKEFSVGEAMYTGGEVPAMAVIDATARRLPGILGKDESVEERRVASSAVYTRPAVIAWKGKKYGVPAVLTTGHHAKINEWRGKIRRRSR